MPDDLIPVGDIDIIEAETGMFAVDRIHPPGIVPIVELAQLDSVGADDRGNVVLIQPHAAQSGHLKGSGEHLAD